MLIDAHAHVWGSPEKEDDPWGRDKLFVEAMDAVGIDIAVVSNLGTPRPATVEGFQKCNRDMLAALKEFRGRLWGYAYVNSGYSKEAVAEIEYCLEADEDCIGVKLYNEYQISDPAVRPVIEKCIELDVPILEHAGHSLVNAEAQPNITDSAHAAALGRLYPEVKLIVAHLGGGGDWEWEIKELRDTSPNVGADTSGSVTDEGMIEYAIEILGADRLYFGCDMSVTAGVGKFMSAKMSDEDRNKIASENFLRLVGREA